MQPQIVGWVASVILLVTVAGQIYRQWAAGTSKGVSRWLFVGQIAASAGFAWYSVMIGERIFIATNLLMLLASVTGLVIVLYHRRKNPSESESATEG